MKHISTFPGLLFSATAFLLLCTACNQEDNSRTTQSDKTSDSLFELIDPAYSGVNFNNEIQESENFNYLIYDGIYQGAGVGVGDFNNDGLQDIFFTGNMTPDRLFINKGDFKFQDISVKARVDNSKGWSAGVAVADVNADGWLDIYVCRFLLDDPALLRNLLYINNGDLTFTESAASYGIDDPGLSIQANFFDYDKDGWLDLYVANQPPNNRSLKPAALASKDSRYSDRLYKNNGNGTFTDVTKQAGITNFSYSLSATVSDLNKDGWPDIYVGCDYYEPDFYYQNNGDGTFTEIIHTAMRHISNFSMGADIADFNNDGWMDIYVADMVAEDNFRNKTNMSGMNPAQFWGIAKKGGHYQYMFNTLQLNNGNGYFSEIAQLSGVSKTDWSWAPLFADFDGDGWKDLYVTNGIMRDVRNKDYHKKSEEVIHRKMLVATNQNQSYSLNPMEIISMAPSQKLVNYLYRNNGDLTFDKKMKEWEADQPGWSHGAAYADLDNDGDLDLVVNNMNAPAFIYKNRAVEKKLSNYLNLKLVGEKPNLNSLGAVVEIQYDGNLQIQEVSPFRGYMSTSENIVHFGVGNKKSIDKLTVRWLDGKEIVMQNVATNQKLTLHQKDAKPSNPAPAPAKKLFKDISSTAGVDFLHKENDYDDYKDEILLPHRMSFLGPALATSDVNGDGLHDFFIGGAAGQGGALYLQKPGSAFQKAPVQPWTADAKYEDTGTLFFDADADGDPDLYISSGGNEFPAGSPMFQDRLYLNDGKGNFTKAAAALPNISISSSKAKAADFDKDGDLDLFVGGRQVPSKYGYPASSLLLRNDKGVFKDVSAEVAPQLKNLGMVTDAQWLDVDNDGDADLIVVGEWMPITLFKNDNGKLTNATADLGLTHTAGWWNCIEAADMDNDGDPDLIAGNLGLNLKFKASVEHPFKCYVKDFDGNGSNDVYLGYYDSDGVCYPVRGRQCSSQQMPFIAEKFPTYEAFARTDIEHVLEGKINGAVNLQTEIFETIYLENLGNGKFKLVRLPHQAQISPTFGVAVADWNKDGKPDLFLAGNYYEREVETTRSDAGIGCVLLGDGKGNFTPVKPWETGVIAYKDVRDVKMIKNSNNNPIILVANNSAALQLYQLE